ncbi:MAG TPA: FmdB family zinc ribbon protein [Terracidiphilus sp.]
MPLYAYRCTQCGHQYEKVQKFSAEPEIVCPQCGGPLERPLTAPALQFKGSGWYINDYAPKPASGNATKSAADSSSSTAKSEPSSTPATPAAAPASSSSSSE